MEKKNGEWRRRACWEDPKGVRARQWNGIGKSGEEREGYVRMYEQIQKKVWNQAYLEQSFRLTCVPVVPFFFLLFLLLFSCAVWGFSSGIQ